MHDSELVDTYIGDFRPNVRDPMVRVAIYERALQYGVIDAEQHYDPESLKYRNPDVVHYCDPETLIAKKHFIWNLAEKRTKIPFGVQAFFDRVLSRAFAYTHVPDAQFTPNKRMLLAASKLHTNGLDRFDFFNFVGTYPTDVSGFAGVLALIAQPRHIQALCHQPVSSTPTDIYLGLLRYEECNYFIFR